VLFHDAFHMMCDLLHRLPCRWPPAGSPVARSFILIEVSSISERTIFEVNCSVMRSVARELLYIASTTVASRAAIARDSCCTEASENVKTTRPDNLCST
jgi:hypothetical protein